jgi:hypothetical protein
VLEGPRSSLPDVVVLSAELNQLLEHWVKGAGLVAYRDMAEELARLVEARPFNGCRDKAGASALRQH